MIVIGTILLLYNIFKDQPDRRIKNKQKNKNKNKKIGGGNKNNKKNK